MSVSLHTEHLLRVVIAGVVADDELDDPLVPAVSGSSAKNLSKGSSSLCAPYTILGFISPFRSGTAVCVAIFQL